MSQTLGGIFFALFGGQPLIVMLTTAPLAIYIKSKYYLHLLSDGIFEQVNKRVGRGLEHSINTDRVLGGPFL